MEDLGYDIGYVGQHRFSDVTAMGGDTASEPSAPLTMVSAILSRTTRLKMCTNIMLLPAHHPIEIAEEVNTLNELSNKRFVLGDIETVLHARLTGMRLPQRGRKLPAQVALFSI